MKAYGNNVIVKRNKAPKETAGGIIIPDASGNEISKCRGEIISVGTVDGDIQVGDEIIFSSCFEFKNKTGMDYVVVAEKDILVVSNE